MGIPAASAAAFGHLTVRIFATQYDTHRSHRHGREGGHPRRVSESVVMRCEKDARRTIGDHLSRQCVQACGRWPPEFMPGTGAAMTVGWEGKSRVKTFTLPVVSGTSEIAYLDNDLIPQRHGKMRKSEISVWPLEPGETCAVHPHCNYFPCGASHARTSRVHGAF